MLNLRAALAFGHGGAVAGLGCLITLAAPASADAQVVAFTGATVWDGTGASARPGSTIVVERGRIADVGPDAAIPPGADVVSLTGKFVIPGLVNAHGHATGNWAPDPRAEDAERVREDLLLYARYGVTSVNSLGDGTAALAVARAQDPAPPHARLMAAGPVVIDREPAGARATARENVRHGAAWLKLRVDDNLGTSEPMPWNAVEAVFEVGRETGVPVATHLFYLDDARRLLDMGTGLVAHSVRDTRVDDGFARRLAESGICYVPTLTRELSTFVYADRPSFFDDPFFQRHALDDEVHRLEHPTTRARYRDNPTAEGYRVALERAVDNLVLLHEAGVRIAFGTGSR